MKTTSHDYFEKQPQVVNVKPSISLRALRINVIVLCIIAWILCMSVVWLNYCIQKSDRYGNSLIEDWDWLNAFLELSLASAINLRKMSLKRTEWDTSQFAPKNLKRTDHCICGHLVHFYMFLSSMHA
jgi:hypothetical protein